MDKCTKILGFGHCLHLSSSGLLATLQLTRRGNAGASGRFLSLSPPILCTDAATKHSSGPDRTLSANQPLPDPLPPSSLLPSLLPGLPGQGFQPGLWVILSPGASPSLGCYKEMPWKYWGQVPQDGRSHPVQSSWSLLDQQEEETCSHVDCVCQETLDLGPSISRAKCPRVCVWGGWLRLLGASPLRIAPQPFPQGVATLNKVCWWRTLSSPTSGQNKDARRPQILPFRWQGIPSLMSPGPKVHA